METYDDCAVRLITKMKAVGQVEDARIVQYLLDSYRDNNTANAKATEKGV